LRKIEYEIFGRRKNVHHFAVKIFKHLPSKLFQRLFVVFSLNAGPVKGHRAPSSRFKESNKVTGSH
jgi:hypothetical protein